MPDNDKVATLNDAMQAALDERFADGWNACLRALGYFAEVAKPTDGRWLLPPPNPRAVALDASSPRLETPLSEEAPHEIDGLVGEAEMSRRLNHHDTYIAQFRRIGKGPAVARVIDKNRYYNPEVAQAWHDDPTRKRGIGRPRKKARE